MQSFPGFLSFHWDFYWTLKFWAEVVGCNMSYSSLPRAELLSEPVSCPGSCLGCLLSSTAVFWHSLVKSWQGSAVLEEPESTKVSLMDSADLWLGHCWWKQVKSKVSVGRGSATISGLGLWFDTKDLGAKYSELLLEGQGHKKPDTKAKEIWGLDSSTFLNHSTNQEAHRSVIPALGPGG